MEAEGASDNNYDVSALVAFLLDEFGEFGGGELGAVFVEGDYERVARRWAGWTFRSTACAF